MVLKDQHLETAMQNVATLKRISTAGEDTHYFGPARHSHWEGVCALLQVLSSLSANGAANGII
jgi:hypothetical protein